MSKSFFKKALGTIIEFDNKSENAPPDPNLPLKQQMTNTQSTPVVQSFATQPETTTTTVSSTVKTHILNLIKESNLPGPDYYEYTLMLEALKAVPMLNIRYDSAFKALNAQGMTMETLLKSAEQYKAIIKNDQKEFETAFGATFKAQVADKKSLIEQKTKEVQELAIKIQTLNSEINTANSEVANAELQLSNQKSQYIAAGNSVISEIDVELTNIKTYITQ
jgi:hypothetical protein